MRSGRVVVNAVALAQIFDVITDLNFKASAHDKVKFLSGVGGQVNWFILLIMLKFVFNPVRLGDLFTEKGSKVLYLDAVFLCRVLPLALARDGVG